MRSVLLRHNTTDARVAVLIEPCMEMYTLLARAKIKYISANPSKKSMVQHLSNRGT